MKKKMKIRTDINEVENKNAKEMSDPNLQIWFLGCVNL